MKRPAALLCLSLFATVAFAAEKPMATDFTFEDINPQSATFGDKITLSEVYPERGVAINFLASWCDYCWKELPHLQEIAAAGEARVLGIAADEYGGPLESVVTMLERYEVTLPVLWVDEAAAAELEKRYTYERLPATYLIDAEGRIEKVLEGVVPPEQLREEIARALPTP